MVSLKHKVTIKTKIAQEESSESLESKKVTLKRKQPDTPETLVGTSTSPNKHPKKLNMGKIIGGFIGVAAIVACVFFFINRDKIIEGDKDSSSIEMIAKNGDNQEVGNGVSGSEDKISEAPTDDNTSPDKSVKNGPSEGKDTPEDYESTSNSSPIEESKVAKTTATPTSTSDNAKTAKLESSSTENTSKSTTSSSTLVSGDIEENARRVIRGDFGNGQERKNKLGASYSEIQGKVNEMYRKGLVY